jgi:hypothetical protein
MKLVKTYKDIFKKTLQAIWKRKLLFLIMFVLQLAFLSIFFYIAIIYQIEIFEDIDGITSPIENLDINEENLENPDSWQVIMSQYATVNAAYQSLIKNVSLLGIWTILLYFTFNATLWVSANFMLSKGWPKKISLKKKLKLLSKSWLKYFVSTLIMLIPFSVVAYYIAVSVIKIAESLLPISVKILMGIFLILIYILLVSYTQLGISSWKNYLKSIVKVAFLRVHYTLLAFLITLLVIILPSFLFYYSTMYWMNFPVMILSAFLIILMLVVTKVFLVAAGQGIRKV